MNYKKIGIKFKNEFGLNYPLVGMTFSDTRPENAIGFARKGSGCIMPLIFSAAKGKTVAFDKDTTGWDCSAFYLGYKEWIFDGIECFLSDGIVFGRKGERFVKTKEQAKAFVQHFKPKAINDKVTIFKPLSEFSDHEYPEVVLFFVTPDEMSGLIFLLHFNAPEREDLVTTRFISACGSVVTLPMKYRSEGQKKAVCGMHDISARLRFPKNLMTLAMPFDLVADMYNEMDNSFVITENWEKIRERNLSEQ
jgi:uncharacterized protein (DUF169 family)